MNFQQLSMQVPEAAPEYDPREEALRTQLRLEHGWRDVSNGLGRMLLGYLILFVVVPLLTALVLGITFSLTGPNAGGGQGASPAGSLWIFLVCLIGVAVTIIWGYSLVVHGKFTCLLHSPERQGARMFLFVGLTALVMSPVLGILTNISFTQSAIDFDRGVAAFTAVRYTMVGKYMLLASAGLTAIYFFAFVLFLRAVAQCFDSTPHVVHVNIFLFVAALVFGLSVAAQLFIQSWGWQEWLCLGLGQAGVGVWYLVLIANIRQCIEQGMGRARSPLEV